jgi:transposase
MCDKSVDTIINRRSNMYSIDFRRLAFIKYQRCRRIRETARMMEVSPSTVHRWMHSGSWNGVTLHKKRHSSFMLHDSIIRRYLDENQATTIVGLHTHLRNLGLRMSLSSVRRRVNSLSYKRKRLSDKVLGFVSKEQIEAYRRRHDVIIGPSTLVLSLDECHFSENVMPRYGYSAIGKRCICRQRSGSWTSKSLVLGIASDGTKYCEVVRGSVTRGMFGGFIQRLPYPPGTVIFMDNCSVHKKLDDIFARKGFIPLFLSPYSPQFQPVELAFSKVKGAFRNSFPWYRGVDSSIHECVSMLTTCDIQAFFRHSERQLRVVYTD